MGTRPPSCHSQWYWLIANCTDVFTVFSFLLDAFLVYSSVCLLIDGSPRNISSGQAGSCASPCCLLVSTLCWAILCPGWQDLSSGIAAFQDVLLREGSVLIFDRLLVLTV